MYINGYVAKSGYNRLQTASLAGFESKSADVFGINPSSYFDETL